MPDAEAARLRRANIAKIEKECASKSGHRCDVVTLFAGARYDLYEYKKYTDIRLVFAPEFALAFFGGDPRILPTRAMTSTSPSSAPMKTTSPPVRWILPLQQRGRARWRADLHFSNPGTTGRLMTVAQLEFLRDTDYPLRQRRLKSLADDLLAWSAGATRTDARRRR